MAGFSLHGMRTLLERVSRVRVTAREGRGVRFRGEGDVVVSTGPDGSLLVSESGIWRDRGGPGVRFSNAYRWRFGSDVVVLSHERRGPGEAVVLVELIPVGPGRWVSRDPHVCGEDVYAATLRVGAGRLTLRWRVSGPRKQQFVRAVYARPEPTVERPFAASDPGETSDRTGT